MGTTTLASLRQLLAEAIGDWRPFDTSTNITTGTTARIIATTLSNTDWARDDFYNTYWALITEGNNSGVKRRVKDYLTTATMLKFYGSAFAAESSAVTCELHRFDPSNYTRALNRAMEQLYPGLYRRLDDLTLVTGNHIPDGSFEWWTASATHKFFTGTNATLAQTTTAGLYRGQRGTTSMKVTANTANGYALLSSDNYPRLLDLMGHTVNAYVWATPQTANDASIVIYTKKADGTTTQTLPSTTATPASGAPFAPLFTLIKHEDQTLNDDLIEIQIRLKVATNGQYCYFDDLVLCGKHLYEYMLPYDFQVGHLNQVWVQTSGYSDEPYNDIHPRYWERVPSRIIDDGTYKYLRLGELHTNFRRLRLIGTAPLETLSTEASDISLDGEKLNLIIAQAAYELYKMERGSVSVVDKSQYDQEMMFWQVEARRLRPHLSMITPPSIVWTGY